MDWRIVSKTFFLLTFVLCVTASIASTDNSENPFRLSIIQASSMENERIGQEIRKQLLDNVDLVQEEDAADWQALYAFYEERQDTPAFIGPTGYNEIGSSLIKELSNAGDWGLNSEDFSIFDASSEPANKIDLSFSQKVEKEKKLGLMILKYARFARGGRIPDPPMQLSSYLDRGPQYVDPKKLLQDIMTARDPATVLRGTNPQNPQFEKLRQKFLELKIQGPRVDKNINVPIKGPNLQPGQVHPDIAIVRNQLEASKREVIDREVTDEAFYDDSLVEKVKKFQMERGFKGDGILNSRTRTALNTVEKPNLQRLLANMEMWRWMPDQLGEVYVWVNIPEFLVRVVKNGEIIHEERIISGTLQNQTPIFSDTMETIYFNPRWTVPESIKILELYPSLVRSKGKRTQGLQLLRNGKQVDPSKIDWKQTDIRKFDIYQPSGSSNALGLIKFAFPNKHSVYLHDTPMKNLFNSDIRAFSHGCMRVRNPMKLAEVLLMEDKGWSAEQVRALQKSKSDEIPVKLEKKIPVHITYFTALVGEDETLKISKDLYGHEQRVKLALDGKFDQIVRGKDHLAPVPFANTQIAETPEDWNLLFGGGGTTNRYDEKNTALNDFFNNMFGGY